MIGRRGFIAGLLASAAMPMLVDKHRVVHISMDFGPEPEIVWSKGEISPLLARRQSFVFAERNRYIMVSNTFKELFDKQLAKSTA